jgi:hypothetical protein
VILAITRRTLSESPGGQPTRPASVT